MHCECARRAHIWRRDTASQAISLLFFAPLARTTSHLYEIKDML